MLNFNRSTAVILIKLVDRIIADMDKVELSLTKVLVLCKEEPNINIRLFLKLSKLEIKLHVCQSIMNQIKDIVIAKVKTF